MAIEQCQQHNEIHQRRDALMVVAVLVASITYTAGLSPPGGFWQDDLNGHEAGSSILRDKYPHQYTAFYYANATAFMASLFMIMVIMSVRSTKDSVKIKLMYISMILSLVSLIIAYVAGSQRRLSSSIYVFVLGVGLVVYQSLDYFHIALVG